MRTPYLCKYVSLLLLAMPLVTVGSAAARADEEPEEIAKNPSPFKRLAFRNVGPATGGRVCRVAGVPGQPLVAYAATASSGIWKTSDGGLSWQPLFEKEATASVGSLAVAPSAPHIVYVGTGEANIRGNVVSGAGIYKSTDAGKTWTCVWKQKAQIGTLIVHPADPNIAFAAVLGSAFGPSSERGVYRTLDGGKTWQKVLFKDNDTGASDVCFDPSNPTILFAGLWQTRRRPWELTSGGPGSGLYVSRDGGDTWKQLTGRGLPDGPWGRVGVGVAASDGQRVYALIEAEDGGLFRSDDGGTTWTHINDDRRLRQRAWYYTTLTIHPTNEDIVYFPQVTMLRTVDGGNTLEEVEGFHHGDHHDLWFDPTNPRRMIAGNDGGVDLSINGGKTWFAPPLPLGQVYRIAVDDQTPYHVYGTMQDIGSAGGPSNSLNSAGIRLADWYSVGGGETGYVVPSRRDPHLIFAGEYMGIITRFDRRTRQARNVSIYPDNGSGHGAEDLKYRFRWPAPIAGSPHDPAVLYHAANVLFCSRDDGQTWTAISPDLTRNDKKKQRWSGGPITGDNTGAEFYCTISAVAESPKQKGLIWVGTDDGLVQLSRDAGKTWTNLTANLPSYPEWATVKMIEPSPFAAGTAYVVIDAHLLDDTRPYLFQTTDFGATWTSLSAGLANDVYLHVVRCDPKRAGLLYLGTERGVQVSFNDGKAWESLQLNLPTVPVSDLLVKDHDLVLGTNGRALWILDDVTPLRQWDTAIAEKPLHVLPASPAVRWLFHGPVSGHNYHGFPNPPQGAIVHYHLAKEATTSLTLEIRDARGQLIRRFTSKPAKGSDKEPAKKDPAKAKDEDEEQPRLATYAGLHRFVWDLSHEGGKEIKDAVADMGSAKVGPRVNPGRYTATFILGDAKATTTLQVLPDPRHGRLPEGLVAQERMALDLRGDLNRLVREVERVRLLRKQLADRNELLADVANAKGFVERSSALMDKLDALEERLHNPKAKIAYDILAQKGGAKLYSRLIFVYNAILDGDGAPTQGMRDMVAELRKEFAAIEGDLARLVNSDLRRLNETAKRRSWPIIFDPPAKRDHDPI